MSERWWVVMTKQGYMITNQLWSERDAVRGPFASYEDAEEYRDWWEKKQMSRERVAAYVVILWLGFGMIVFAAAAAELLRGLFR
jgi:hypothetical protein